MNIFILDRNPKIAAQQQCDKHVVKMIVESAQMLSTAHRILDGTKVKRPSVSGKRIVNYWEHPNSNLEKTLYKAVHPGHPSTLWTMESIENYYWHYEHWISLCDEYEFRYKKIHSTKQLLEEVLNTPPKNIPMVEKTPFKLAMKDFPQCQFPDDPVKSYRLFYQTKQERFKMVWSKRKIPDWFEKKSLTQTSNSVISSSV